MVRWRPHLPGQRGHMCLCFACFPLLPPVLVPVQVARLHCSIPTMLPLQLIQPRAIWRQTSLHALPEYVCSQLCCAAKADLPGSVCSWHSTWGGPKGLALLRQHHTRLWSASSCLLPQSQEYGIKPCQPVAQGKPETKASPEHAARPANQGHVMREVCGKAVRAGQTMFQSQAKACNPTRRKQMESSSVQATAPQSGR
jgi:hypothetical protein